jgi:hypothetical protein
MDCEVYKEQLLAAHADGELDGPELEAAEMHLRDCVRCRMSLADERRLKALVRNSATIVHVPADARLRIRAALGSTDATADRASVRRGPGRYAAGANRGSRVARWLYAEPLRVALPFAAIAASVLIAALFAQSRHQPVIQVAHIPETSVFDLAMASYDSLARGFAPNVATASAAESDGSYYAWVVDRGSPEGSTDDSSDLARAYHEAGVPEEIYDFSAAGYGLYGGRIDHSVDGWPMTYTLYRGDKGEILSICMHASGFAAPTGASYWAGTHSFFRYKDHSLCLTFSPSGHFVSILVANEPVAELLRDVTLADGSSAS